MRLSHYSIPSTPLPDGSVILFNSIHGTLDRICAEDAHRIFAGARGELPEGTREILKERGHLTYRSMEEELAIGDTITDTLHEAATKLPSFMIVPNLDCNYRCSYCFERPLQKTIKIASAEINHHKKNVVMTEMLVERAFASIEEIEGLSDAPAPHLVLYGGEPLDRSNRAVVEHIVLEAERRGRYFSAITNGHDLMAFEELLGPTRIAEVQISFDGLREQHDKTRISISKESSFDTIVANIDDALRRTEVSVQLRVHVESHNLASVEPLLAFFEQRGWFDSGRVVAYANVVYRKDAGQNVSTQLTASELATKLSEVQRRYPAFFPSAPAVHAARTVAEALLLDKRVAIKGSYCAANTGNYIFAPDGAIYSCWESVGKECSRIGRYSNGLMLDPQKTSAWFSRRTSSIPQCRACEYRMVCGGGCAQFAEYNNGTQLAAYCDDFQQTFRQALTSTVSAFLNNA